MHNIEYYDYSTSTNKKEIYAELNERVERYTWGEGGNGIDEIRWNDHVCDNYEQAQKWIEQHDKGWYDCLAVRFYSPVVTKSEKIIELDRKIREAYDAYRKKDQELYIKKRTSEFIGCKKCGSRMNSQYLSRNYCPVCGGDLRSDTILKSIASAKNKWENAKKNREDYVNKHSKKEIRWLVKIEYHT